MDTTFNTRNTQSDLAMDGRSVEQMRATCFQIPGSITSQSKSHWRNAGQAQNTFNDDTDKTHQTSSAFSQLDMFKLLHSRSDTVQRTSGLDTSTPSMFQRPRFRSQEASESCEPILSNLHATCFTPINQPKNSQTYTTFDEDAQDDSDGSWTDADHQTKWYLDLQESLSRFLRDENSMSILTTPLSTKQRRKVHEMSHLLQLSHMSLGPGRLKKMLLAKCELIGPCDNGVDDKRWNPGRAKWTSGFLDAKAIIINFLEDEVTASALTTDLEVARLPVPRRICAGSDNSSEWPYPEGHVRMYFTSPSEAAAVLAAFESGQSIWRNSNELTTCHFLYGPGKFDSAKTQYLGNLLPSSARINSTRSPLEGTSTSSCRQVSDPQFQQELHEYSLSSHNHQRDLSCSSSVHDGSAGGSSGYVSASSSSATSFIHSEYSSDTAMPNRKRKRQPVVIGGYPCLFPECNRVFDRDGDRRKHQKNHASDKPHQCGVCEKGFVWPKDLKRHQRTHSNHDSDEDVLHDFDSSNFF